MTDEPFDEPDFDDPAHAEIRDLLADARVRTPIPDEVAARLDATLAELAGKATAADDATPAVVPLRRRSRVAPRLLAAAAVIVVAGAGAVGLNQVMQGTSGSNDEAPMTTARDASGSAVQPEAHPPGPQGGSDGDLDLRGNGRTWSASGSVPVLTSADFAAQASKLYQARDLTVLTSLTDSVTKASGQAATPTPTTSYNAGAENASPQPRKSSLLSGLSLLRGTAANRAISCTGPKLPGTTSYPIVLDGKPAVLVLHRASSGTRTVEAWSCAGSTVLAVAVIPS
jgi:hypothetical protein